METKELYQWFGKGVLKALFKYCVAGMLAITLITLSWLLLKIVNASYTYPNGYEYRFLALLPVLSFCVLYWKGFHEKIASHLTEDSTLSSREKEKITILAVGAGLWIGIIYYVLNGIIINAVGLTVFTTTVAFGTMYLLIYYMDKNTMCL